MRLLRLARAAHRPNRLASLIAGAQPIKQGDVFSAAAIRRRVPASLVRVNHHHHEALTHPLIYPRATEPSTARLVASQVPS